MEIRSEVFPVLAEFHPEESEREAPDVRSDQRVYRERQQLHPRHARRKSDERAHHRQHPAPEYGMRSPSFEETVGGFEFVLGDQDVAAVTHEEGTSAVLPDEIRDVRSEQASERARDRDRV